MESKFKVGDRVSVYLSADTPPHKGVVTRVEQASLKVKIDENQFSRTMPAGPFHPKQCRRLIKKPRRRVWILESELRKLGRHGTGLNDIQVSSAKHMSPDVEFVEVKPK